MHAGDYSQWYYLIYLGPGGVAMMVLLLSAMGGGRHHKGGHRGGHAPRVHSGGGPRHAGGGPRPTGTGPKHSGGGPRHSGNRAGGRNGQARHGSRTAKAAPQGGAAARVSALEQMALFFGFGAVPLPFLIGGAMMGWGLTGVWATEYWYQRYGGAGAFWIPSMVCAVIGALLFQKFIAMVGEKMMPQTESASVSNIDLCGLVGTVVYPASADHGRIHIYDDYGTMHDVSARVAGDVAAIDRGRKVLVVDYDATRDLLIVEPAP